MILDEASTYLSVSVPLVLRIYVIWLCSPQVCNNNNSNNNTIYVVIFK